VDHKLLSSRSAPAPDAVQARVPRAQRSPAAEPPGPERILRLQRLAGNRAVGELLGKQRPTAVAARPIRASVQRKPARRAKPPTADERRRTRATSLKGADARVLLKANMPFALAIMTDSQVGQMQRVLDATVVNPEVEKEADALHKKAVIRDFGYRQDRDPRITRQEEKVRKDYTKVGKADQRILLDHSKLLTKDALTARTDNPDEGNYLARVAFTLNKRGIYLRFTPKPIRDPEDPSVWTIDPRNFETWLSLGPEGDTIPTKDGQITRDSILKTQLLGAGYYENVHIGPAQNALKREIKRLTDAIELGIEHHNLLQRIRDDAAPGVAEASDLFGGADFPDTLFFDRAHKLVVRALELNVGGNLQGSKAFLLMASVLTRQGANQLKAYVEDTSTGADRVVTVLKVAKTAGEVAGVALAITGIPGLVRGGVRLVAGEGAVGAAEVGAAEVKYIDGYIKSAGHGADELNAVRAMKGPKGSVAGGVKPGTSSGAGQGWHKMH
jgi:hypothetical protein